MKNVVIYQAKNGSIEFKGDYKKETIWGTQKQIAELFGVNRSVVTRHIKNIFKDKELEKNKVSAKFAQTTKHGAIKGKTQTKSVEFYNLDIILAVGYRTSSTRAIDFRKWATKTLKQHLIQGYTINKKQIGKNYDTFIQAVSDVKALLPKDTKSNTGDILELIKSYADTWISLEAYDKGKLPKNGSSKKSVVFTTKELKEAIEKLKEELMGKKQATEIFAQERNKDALESIIGSIFQSAFGKDAYPSNEEKAANLLYFIVKNHPFVDGNKRTGAFAFVWFLNKVGLLRANITPQALTGLTLLIAESNPKDKGKMTGLVLLLLKNKS